MSSLCYNHLMILETFNKVYYSDTDAYGVVWHGAYLRWLEMGRMDFCDKYGVSLKDLSEEGITIPVVNININYKSPARLYDELIIQTEILKFSRISITFKQIIKNKTSDKIFVNAEINVVCVNNSGELYRKIPDKVLNLCKRASNEA